MHKLKLGISSFALLLISTAAGAADEVPASTVVAVRAAHLIDGVHDRPVDDAVVLISDENITAFGSNLAIPATAQLIDLGGATVLSGLIDCHVHIADTPGDYYTQLFRRSPIDVAVSAHRYPERTLQAGFTTMGNLGSPELIDVALRNAIDRDEESPARAFSQRACRLAPPALMPTTAPASRRISNSINCRASPMASTRCANSCASTSSTAPM